MSVIYQRKLMQGSDAWIEARRGLLTASEMDLVLTPTLKTANNGKTRAHVYEMMAQRITGKVDPAYFSDDMLRGQEDEQYALSEYGDVCEPVDYCGFITNDKWGFTIGYSPDGLVGENGLVECKSRRSKYQMQTICEHIHAADATGIPQEYVLQCQTALLVSEREWIDFISYSAGLPMVVVRVWPDEKIQEAIVAAATEFEASVASKMRAYEDALANYPRLFQTEDRKMGDMVL